MKGIITFVLIFWGIIGANAQTPTNFVRSIYFATAKHEITAESQTTLSEVLRLVKPFESYTLTIQGNTDDVGSVAYNKKLSGLRADAVKLWLTENGMATTNIFLAAYGEESPIADNFEEEGRQKNRRVDIIVNGVLPKPKPKPTPIPPKTSPNTTSPTPAPEVVIDDSKIQDLYESLTDKPQEFEIDVKRDYVLQGEQGTVLYYKANSLQTSCPKVKLYLKEVYKKSDMILAKLSTQTNAQGILESDGMFRIDIIDCNGREVLMKPNQTMAFAIPTLVQDPLMRLYKGRPDEKRNNSIVWDSRSIGELGRLDYSNCMNCGTRPSTLCGKVGFKDFIIGIVSQSKRQSNQQKRICNRIKRVDRKRQVVYKKASSLEKQLPNAKKLKDSTRALEIQEDLAALRRKGLKLSNRLLALSQKQIPAPPIAINNTAREKCFDDLSFLAARLGITDLAAFISALSPRLLSNGEIDKQEVANTMRAMYLSNIQNNVNINVGDLRYYIGQARLDMTQNWVNCDTPILDKLVPLIVNLPPAENINISVVMKNRDVVMLPVDNSKQYKIKTLENEPAYIIVLKYQNKQAYLGFKEITTKANLAVDISFEAMTAEEIKQKLETLN